MRGNLGSPSPKIETPPTVITPATVFVQQTRQPILQPAFKMVFEEAHALRRANAMEGINPHPIGIDADFLRQEEEHIRRARDMLDEYRAAAILPRPAPEAMRNPLADIADAPPAQPRLVRQNANVLRNPLADIPIQPLNAIDMGNRRVVYRNEEGRVLFNAPEYDNAVEGEINPLRQPNGEWGAPIHAPAHAVWGAPIQAPWQPWLHQQDDRIYQEAHHDVEIYIMPPP